MHDALLGSFLILGDWLSRVTTPLTATEDWTIIFWRRPELQRLLHSNWRLPLLRLLKG